MHFWKHLVSLSHDQYGKHLERPVNADTLEPDQTCIWLAHADSEWTEWMKVRADGKGVLPDCYKITKQDAHEVWAVRNVATMPPHDLTDYLRDFETEPGWIACRHKPDSDVVTSVCLRSRLVPTAWKPGMPAPKLIDVIQLADDAAIAGGGEDAAAAVAAAPGLVTLAGPHSHYSLLYF